MSWIKFDNVTLTNDSELVVINNGDSIVGVQPGYALIAAGLSYEVIAVSGNAITLGTKYLGDTQNNVTVKIQQTHGPLVELINTAIEVMQNSTGTGSTPTTPIVDITAPVIVTPNALNIEFVNGGAGVAHNNATLVAWLNSAVAVDNVDSNLTVTHNLANLPNPLAAATHTVTFSATDTAGNTGTSSALINASEAGSNADTTAPLVTPPNALNIEFVNGGAGVAHNNATLVAWLNSASAVDNVDSNLTVTNNLATLPNPLTEAAHLITFSATDAANNTGTASASVVVSETGGVDNVAPVISISNKNITLEFVYGSGGISHTDPTLLNILNAVTAADNVDGNVTVTNNLATLANPMPESVVNIIFSATDAAGNTGSDYITFTLQELAPPNTMPVAAPRTANVSSGVSTVMVLGNAYTGSGDTVVFTVTGSTAFTMGPATNELTYLNGANGSEVLTVTATNGSDSVQYDITVNTGASVTSIPTSIAFAGWSTMNYSLEGNNTAASTSPGDEHNPSVYKLVGQMYLANGIAGYTDDFEFLSQGSQFIDGTQAVNHVNATSATVMVFSAYGSESGITADPVLSNQTPGDGAQGWVDRMVNIASLAEGRGIKPIMYQCWGSAGTDSTFGNALINSDALQAKKGMLVIRTAEIVKLLGEVNTNYITNTPSDSIFGAPVTHLYSGDPAGADNFHGSYGMAYMVALATFKTLTGISAADNAFVIPSGGNVGNQYGMPAQFITDIIAAVDLIQKESVVSGLAEGAAPMAANFSRDLEHNKTAQINVITAGSLLDDVEINTSNLELTTINAAYFSSHSFTDGILTLTPNDTLTGATDIVFTYTDADSQAVTITLTANLIAAVVIPSQEIIINFGSGNGSSLSTNGNLYNHTVTVGSGKTINHIRQLDTAGVTQGALQDADGTGVGSVTAISQGVLNGGGYGGNADPVVYHYGPYEDLYANQSAIENTGAPVQFSLNGFTTGDKYRVGVGGFWGSNSDDNIFGIHVNQVAGQMNVRNTSLAVYDHVVSVDYAGRLVFDILALLSNTQSYGGLSYIWLNKITDSTPAETPLAPEFILEPISINAVAGDTVTFTCDAWGANRFQWLLDAALISGKTANSYARTIEASDDGKQITVQGIGAGGTTLSAVATIGLIVSAPSIVTPLQSTATVKEGDNLIIDAVTQYAQTIQWYLDGADIPGQTNFRLNYVVGPSDHGKTISYTTANTIDSATSTGCVLTVVALQTEYWFAFGDSSGPVVPLTDTWSGSKLAGNGGEVINGFRHMPDLTATVTAGLQDTQGADNGLVLAFSSIGSDTSIINGWNTDGMADVQQNTNVIEQLNAASIFSHINLYKASIYIHGGAVLRFDFSNGGLIVGETWVVQLVGMHYEDNTRAVDVTVNGVGAAGNMITGPWASMAVFETTATVDANGRIIIDIAPQAGTNFNAMRLMKQSS
jgi:hypothetical protein